MTSRLPLALLLAGCVSPIELTPTSTAPIEVGEVRSVELRYLRLDVSGFEQTLGREELLSLPRAVQERLWLLDLDLSSAPRTPHLLDNALATLRELDPETLGPASRNLQRLLRTTPDSAELADTSFEELARLAPLVGVAPASIVADMVGGNVEDPLLSRHVVSETILDLVVGSHPSAQRRLGPRTTDNPQGVYPVAPGCLPVTLADVAADLATLSERFGPVYEDGVYHPGFLTGETAGRMVGDDFRLTVRTNANALPYKGLDLSATRVESVSSLASQTETLFDFSDPAWLTIEGLVPGVPVIERLTFSVVEHDAFIRGGRSPYPVFQGSSEAWRLPPWTLERVLVEAARTQLSALDAHLEYRVPGDEAPLLEVTVDGGWTEIVVAGGLGAPPPPAYLWDLLLEVGQVRLHDEGLAEGAADVAVTLTDVPVGIDTETIAGAIRANLESDPRSLVDVAAVLLEASSGAPDLYYHRTSPTAPPEVFGDWLYFIAERDIPPGDDGLPVRPYGYAHPGFYADPDLRDKLSGRPEVEGDGQHEKVRVEAGDRLFVEDDAGQVYELQVGGRTPQGALRLDVARVR